jgi:hypothetical protein
MIYVFALIIMTAEGTVIPDKKAYFYSVNRCNYFAERVSRTRYNYWTKRKVQAYCIPEWVNPKNTKILR